MAHALLLSLVILLARPGTALQQPQTAPALDHLAWLAGEWTTTRGSACIEEQWTRPAGLSTAAPAAGQLTARIEEEDGGKPFSVDYVYLASAGGCASVKSAK